MPTDRSSTMIRKLEIAGEIRHVYGIDIPSYLLQGFTVNGLNDMKGLLHDALQRATEQEQGRDSVHPLPGSPVRQGHQGYVTPPVSEHFKTHISDVHPQHDQSQRTRPPVHEAVTPGLALHPNTGTAAQTVREGSETVTASAPAAPKRRGQHVIFGANTLEGTAVCYCTIGQDHGPIGGPTHA